MFSWFGRCGRIKINIMPLLLYHLQAFPAWIPSSFLKAVNHIITSFLWAQKPQKAGPVYSVTAKSGGQHGLARCQHLPYDLPFEMSPELVSPRSSETLGSGGRTPGRGPAGCVALVPEEFASILDHLTVCEMWRIAQKAFCDFSITPTPSPLTLVVGNPAFSPGLCDPRFQDLKEFQRYQVCHFLTN